MKPKNQKENKFLRSMSNWLKIFIQIKTNMLRSFKLKKWLDSSI